MKRASAFARTVAFLTDLLVLAISALLLQLSSFLGYALGAGGLHQGQGNLHLGLLYALTGLFYFTYLNAHGTQTIGKRLVGIRVTTPDGEAIGSIRSLWRSFCYLLSALPFFFGFFLAFFVRGRSLHDVLAGTVVVKEEQ